MRDSKEIIIVGVLEQHYERTARIYGGGGIAPTISARDYKGAIKILVNGNKADNGRKCQ